jgi:hypothetical protein
MRASLSSVWFLVLESDLSFLYRQTSTILPLRYAMF